MGKVIIQDRTVKDPITLIGEEAGICWGADTSDPTKNYKRGIGCLNSEHGRTWEFPDVYMILDGYSSRVIREWYTHIGGAPTRLQASTRYIDYTKDGGFNYIIPNSIKSNPEALSTYKNLMWTINNVCKSLEKDCNIPREDSALLLPLGMTTKIVCKHNFRNLADMSRQRMCTRAYWEYKQLFNDLAKALSNYSEEWKYLVEHYFMPKCEKVGFCTEAKSCGRKPKKED
jgi:thymidylate synthase (FAD)